MRRSQCQNTTDVVDRARRFTPDTGPSQVTSDCDSGETATLNEGPSSLEGEETANLIRDASTLDGEETAGSRSVSLQNGKISLDGVSDSSEGVEEEHTVVCHINLPPPSITSLPNFRWGDTDNDTFAAVLNKAYKETLQCFEVPRGKIGSAFVREVTRQIETYNDATALESVAMKAVMVLPAQLLQRSHPRWKAKDHSRPLENRLLKWSKGGLDSLLHEGQTIQSRLKANQRQHQDEGKTSRSFEKLVSMGNVKAALKLITEHGDQGCLALDSIQPDGRTVKQHLMDKHPPGKPADPSTISDCPPTNTPHPLIFEEIDGPLIKSIIQQMDGAAGPSGHNAGD